MSGEYMWGGGGWMMEGDGIVMEDVYRDGMRNLGGRLVLMLMREGILVGGVVVVVEVMMMLEVEWCLFLKGGVCRRRRWSV